MYMTVNARWRNRRYRSRAELPFTYRISTLSFPLQSCRSRMQKNNPFRNMTTELNLERQLWSGNENVEIRYVNSSSGAGTSASSPGVYRHIYIMYIQYIHLYIYVQCTCLLLAMQKNLHVHIYVYISYIYAISLHIYPILYIYIYI